MQIATYAWLIALLPLMGAILLGLLGKKVNGKSAAAIGSASVLASFVLALLIFFSINSSTQKSFDIHLFNWIHSGSLSVPFNFLLDPLSSIMLLVITGVGFLIHVYSYGYMKDDEGIQRFFAYLNLFIFFMLLLVLGDNYAVMFTGWEGVGLCSYLLIGFWFKNTNYNNAAKKAFIMNRIGDLGFILGVFLIYNTFGSISYDKVFAAAAGFSSGSSIMVAITLLLFVGAMGKSAQIPLYTWLPDAMAGPTPVSALIHAATMVTAGVYMIARSNVLYVLAPFTLSVITLIGVCTALFAATIALTQNDIKKVLAYSTVSQLGFMFAALGAGAFASGVFHLVTHAFFKALLFLAAGSVIHAMSGEQDIRRMGGLRKLLPITYPVFLIGTIAISGIPPFAGFFSKDEILAHVYASSPILYVLLMVASVLTSFYMFRLLFLTFFGNYRGTKEHMHHMHESPSVMTIPLMVLALLSVLGGFIGLPEAWGANHWLNGFLAPVFELSSGRVNALELSHTTELTLMAFALAGALIGLAIAYSKYIAKNQVPAEDNNQPEGLYQLSYNKYYVDELYDKVIVKPLHKISESAIAFLEKNVISRSVDSFGRITLNGSRLSRNLQTGYIGFYIFFMVMAILLILLFIRI